MPLLLIVLVALLIAQVGFWDAIGALLGATLAIALFFLILIAAVALAGYLIFRRVRD